MKIIADTQVHKIASEYAFSTALENHAAAKKTGLRFLAVTDHTGKCRVADGYVFSLLEKYNGLSH